ncbi:hypothetical protein ERO13_A02G011801v2 [Gossypium hirsutum]|uniref:Transmembrane protein n=1 Tax=Gossypium darwinii TaxID=34276 RepID=A0A5D2H942_GOSDA|nr:hypothetical protein ERO13_A02G011801v2 [Gossypium hirsutum]TYH26754.1 hypothetical protein ES288_A02G013900v1 [Gossypium darwinii]
MARLNVKASMLFNFILLISFLLMITMVESKLLNIGNGKVKFQEVMKQPRVACSGIWCPGKNTNKH